MKFLCVECDERMEFADRQQPGDGTMAAVFECPGCGRAVGMLTNPMETQLVSSLGVEIGGRTLDRQPMEDTRRQGAIFLSMLAGRLPRVVHFHWMHSFFLTEAPFGGSVWPSLRSRGFVGTLDALKRSGRKLVWTAHNLANHERKAMAADRRCPALRIPADGSWLQCPVSRGQCRSCLPR